MLAIAIFAAMLKIEVKIRTTLVGHTGAIYSLAGDGNVLYSTGGDGQVVHWNLDKPGDGMLIARMGKQIFSMAKLPMQHTMLLGQMHGGIHVLDLDTRLEKRHLALHTNGVFDLLPFSNHYLVAGGDGLLSLWRAGDNVLGKKVAVSDESLRTLAIHPSGHQLAVGSSDNGIYLLSLPELTIQRKLEVHANSVFTVCYSPDGRYLLSGSRDAQLMVWDVQNEYEPIHKIPAHLYTINHIVYSPDGKLFATAGRDKDVKIWDASTFELLKVLDRYKYDGHVNSVNRLYWGADFLVSAGDDRKIVLWEIEIVS